MPGRIAYLARGNGFGHAARALPVIDALNRLDPAVEVRLASAGTGAEYLRMRGRGHDDLGFPDEDDHDQDATAKLHAYLASMPELDLVVCDELLRVPALCDLIGVPCVFVSCFLGTDPGQDPRQDIMLMGARRIVIPDWPELHSVPPFLDQVEFLGPIVQPIAMSRAAARQELGIGDSFVGAVSLGGLTANRLTYQRELLRTALALWEQNAPSDGALYVLCGSAVAAAELGIRSDDARVRWIGYESSQDPDLYLRSADVVFPSPGSAMLKVARSGIPAVVLREPNWPVGRQHVQHLAGRSSVHVGWNGDAWTTVTDAGVAPTSEGLWWGEPSDLAKVILAELPRG
ncbi:hypothetical protein [Tenggerimyces flavus]|uniref:Glycosyl transferase n=1 Tax=Tenggerimyces flavus TaxID=1708749 RepID=A0ABV7YK79_9ACTN|nr:hypothetical protein [Tenggerimyces flavus]MBM7784160.1 hypothetical protein [Tenggerimyces flavus]